MVIFLTVKDSNGYFLSNLYNTYTGVKYKFWSIVFRYLEYSCILISSSRTVTMGYLLFLCIIVWSYYQEMATFVYLVF